MNEEQKEIVKEIKALVSKLEDSITETQKATEGDEDWRGGAPNQLPSKRS